MKYIQVIPPGASRWQQRPSFLKETRGKEGIRAKREGRGADTSSCGAIALQRKCDTFPIVSLRTRELPLDRKGRRDEEGEVSCRRWTAPNESKHARPRQPRTHARYILAPSSSPCRLPSPIYPSIYQVIAVTGYTLRDVCTCTYICHLPEVNLGTGIHLEVIHW